MNHTSDIDKIKNLIQSRPTYMKKVSRSVNSYHEVVRLWIEFKTTGNLSLNEKIIKDVFSFHKLNIDHVVMYYSKGKSDALLLCKINGNYLNIIIDSVPNTLSGYNYIATFC